MGRVLAQVLELGEGLSPSFEASDACGDGGGGGGGGGDGRHVRECWWIVASGGPADQGLLGCLVPAREEMGCLLAVVGCCCCMRTPAPHWLCQSPVGEQQAVSSSTGGTTSDSWGKSFWEASGKGMVGMVYQTQYPGGWRVCSWPSFRAATAHLV